MGDFVCVCVGGGGGGGGGRKGALSSIPLSHTKDNKIILAALLLDTSIEKVEAEIGTGQPSVTLMCFSEISRHVSWA